MLWAWLGAQIALVSPARAECFEYHGLIRLLGRAATPGRAVDVATNGSHAFVACEGAGLQVVDLTDPDAPLLIGGVATSGAARAIAVAGSFVYVATDSPGLQVVDVSSPASPTIVGSLTLPGIANQSADVVAAGSFAYVASGALYVVDVSNPESPLVVASIDSVGAAVAVSGTYAYVARNGLSVTVRFQARDHERIEAMIYDASGRRVRALVSGRFEAGVHDVPWDGRDEAGRRVAAGVYFVKVATRQGSMTSRLVMLE